MSKLTDYGKATAALLKTIMAPQIGREDICDSIGYVEGTGSPSGVLTPKFVGQWYGDITVPTGVLFYRAIGNTANTQWTYNGDFGVGTVVAGVSPGTVTASK